MEKKQTECKNCGEEFESKNDMLDSEEHLCGGCGNRQDYEHCKKLKGYCIECY